MTAPTSYVRIGTKAASADANAKLQAIRKRFVKVIEELQGVAPQVVLDALQPIKDRADYYCPVDTGALKASGYLVVRVASNEKIVAELGYGKGGRPPYAPIVHERTDVKHKSPTRAKWLQTALNEQIGLVPGRIARALKKQVDRVRELAYRT